MNACDIDFTLPDLFLNYICICDSRKKKLYLPVNLQPQSLIQEQLEVIFKPNDKTSGNESFLLLLFLQRFMSTGTDLCKTSLKMLYQN